MKKVISILVAFALALSCCVVAFASATSCTANDLADHIGWQISDQEVYNVVNNHPELQSAISSTGPLDSDTIAQVLAIFLDDGAMTPDQGRNVCDSLLSFGLIDDAQSEELKDAIAQWEAANPAEDPSSGDGGDGGEGGDDGGSGLPFDIGDITSIFSNLGGNIDLSQFLEGAKSSLGQLFDGIKGAGLPDLSSITGLLGGLGGGSDILGTIMGLLGMGGDDSGDSGNSGTNSGTTPYSPSTNPSGTNSNTAVIPKTADTAPIAAVAALAAVAGVAFVLTRKKNED